MPQRRSEADVAAPVVFYLESRGYDVYQEVEGMRGVADIVALVSAEDWVVEVKATWSLDLLAQCMDRKHVAHRVFCAVPMGKDLDGWQRNAALFEDLGIGVLRVDFGQWYEGGAAVTPYSLRSERPALSEPTWPIRQRCEPGHKTHARAGARSGQGRWTKFRETAERLAEIVKANPGIIVSAAVAKLQHHYANAASARNHLAQLARKGVIDGVELRMEDGMRLYPKQEAA